MTFRLKTAFPVSIILSDMFRIKVDIDITRLCVVNREFSFILVKIRYDNKIATKSCCCNCRRGWGLQMSATDVGKLVAAYTRLV